MLKDFIKIAAAGYAVSYIATRGIEKAQTEKAARKGQTTVEDEVKDELYRFVDEVEKVLNSHNR